MNGLWGRESGKEIRDFFLVAMFSGSGPSVSCDETEENE
jgi:hypothetical protein